jgi:uridine kinase
MRWRQGRSSPRGFFEVSYDLPSLESHALRPFRTEGRYVRRLHDVVTDAAIAVEWCTIEGPTVLVVDGLFLHQDELVPWWDRSVFLDVPFEESVRRMAERDGTHPDPAHPSMHRYVEGQRIYFRTCSPKQRATWVIDNTDVLHPQVVTFEGAAPATRAVRRTQ